MAKRAEQRRAARCDDTHATIMRLHRGPHRIPLTPCHHCGVTPATVIIPTFGRGA